MTTSVLAAEIGNRIRALRTSRGWTQRELARRAGIVNKSVISYYELGERFPTYEVLLRFASLFEVSTDYLLRGGTSRQINVDGLTEDEIEALLILIARLRR